MAFFSMKSCSRCKWAAVFCIASHFSLCKGNKSSHLYYNICFYCIFIYYISLYLIPSMWKYYFWKSTYFSHIVSTQWRHGRLRRGNSPPPKKIGGCWKKIRNQNVCQKILLDNFCLKCKVWDWKPFFGKIWRLSVGIPSEICSVC